MCVGVYVGALVHVLVCVAVYVVVCVAVRVSVCMGSAQCAGGACLCYRNGDKDRPTSRKGKARSDDPRRAVAC